MKKAKKLVDLYLIVLFLLGIIATALRTVAVFTEWNWQTMHFDDNGIITTANLIIVMAIVAFISYFITAKGEENLVASNDGAIHFVPSGLIAAAMIFTAFGYLDGRSSGYISSSPVLSTLSLILFVLGIASAAFFFLSIFIEKNESTWRAAFNMCLVVFLAVSSAYLYFNKAHYPTNSPAKVTEIMAYLFAAIFFLYETRIALGRAQWRAYIATGLIASIVSAYSAIPSIIYYVWRGEVISDSIFGAALMLAISIFITAKIIATRNFSSIDACDEVVCIEALAARREIEISEGHKQIAEADITEGEDAEPADYENYTMEIPMPEISGEGAENN